MGKIQYSEIYDSVVGICFIRSTILYNCIRIKIMYTIFVRNHTPMLFSLHTDKLFVYINFPFFVCEFIFRRKGSNFIETSIIIGSNMMRQLKTILLLQI